jgi:hypothetical protein
VLAFGAVLEAVPQVALGDGQFEVLAAQALHIRNHRVLVRVAPPLLLQPHLQVVDVIVAVFLNVLQLVHLQVGCSV